MIKLSDVYSGMPGGGGVPTGSIIAFIGGYFTGGANTGFTNVLGNDAATINSLINEDGWNVCNGAALNDPDSPIFNGPNRYLPNLTDDRFLMGDTGAGGVGGSSTMAHTHTMAHQHYINHTHPTNNFTLTTSHMPSHRHSSSIYSNNRPFSDGTNYATIFAGGTLYTDYQGGGLAHNHGNTGWAGGGTDGDWSGAATVSTTSAASLTENRPKFLACLYIMKVK